MRQTSPAMRRGQGGRAELVRLSALAEAGSERGAVVG